MFEILRERNHTKELVLTVGKKGRQAMERIGKAVLADFETMSDKPSFLDTIGISRVVVDDFLSGKLDEVYMVYNHFYSAMSQKPVVKKLLPIEPSDLGTSAVKRDYIFEQDREKLLSEMLQRYIETTVYQTVLESLASEHSARMVAMRQASDNASDIIKNLTLHYNKARQAKITKEILEIGAGSSA
jgi:F-type H+-transporting ATPase subunit gamma